MVDGKKDLLESLVKKDKTNNTEETKQDLLKMSEVSIILDTYEDIFSDFDPRPFSQRALSDDFLLEAKKASRERNSGEIEIKFLIPEQKRNIREESLIKKRLHEYFKKHLIQIKDEINSIKKRGYFMICLGIIIMILATIVAFMKSTTFISHLFIIILEPAGWFTFWTGLDQLFYEIKYKKPEYDFYEKMSKVEIKFYSH